MPPFMANRNSFIYTGQLPKFEEDMFKLEGLDYFLILTSEVLLTNIHENEILSHDKLLINYTEYTTCFRSEAGPYRRDKRGLVRQHQFNKVEMVKIVSPEESYDELLENYQQEDGSVIVPEVLRPYMGVDIINKEEL